MKSYLLIIWTFSLLLGASAVFAQNDDFNISEYQQFLESHQDLSSTQLLEMHPAGLFEKKALTSWESALLSASPARLRLPLE